MQSFLRRIDRTVTRCLVCGSSEVRTDEVVDRGIVLLAECPRCEHRWTQPPAVAVPAAAASAALGAAAAMRSVAASGERREVATAA